MHIMSMFFWLQQASAVKSMRAPVLELDHQAVMAGGVAGRFEQPKALGDFLVAGQRLECRRVHVEGRIGGQFLALGLRDVRREGEIRIAEMLEGLADCEQASSSGAVADGAGLGEVLVPAAMIEVIVRVDDVVDVVGLQARVGELARNGLCLAPGSAFRRAARA